MEEYTCILEDSEIEGYSSNSLLSRINKEYDGAQPETILRMATSVRSSIQDKQILVFSNDELFYLKLMGLEKFRVVKCILNEDELNNIKEQIKIENSLYSNLYPKMSDYDISEIVYSSLDTMSFLDKDACNVIKSNIVDFHKIISEDLTKYTMIQNDIMSFFKGKIQLGGYNAPSSLSC